MCELCMVVGVVYNNIPMYCSQIDNYFKNDTFHIASLSEISRLDVLDLRSDIVGQQVSIVQCAMLHWYRLVSLSIVGLHYVI